METCFEERPDHMMTEPSITPLLKIGTTCPIPDRKTTKLKDANFITKCQFANINYQTLGDETILLPSGDLMEKVRVLFNTFPPKFLKKVLESIH